MIRKGPKIFKIVLLNHNKIGEGTYLRCYGLGKELVKSGHRVVLLATSKNKRFKKNKIIENGLELIEFPFKMQIFLFFLHIPKVSHLQLLKQWSLVSLLYPLE